eukprot:752429-Hanusia_phi.AAC.6
MARVRSCTLKPAFMSSEMAAKLGTRNKEEKSMNFFRSRIVRYTEQETKSEMQVARPAPTTPSPSLRTKMGSNAMWKRFEKALTMRGVKVSSVPRKVAKPTVVSMAGTKLTPLARM